MRQARVLLIAILLLCGCNSDVVGRELQTEKTEDLHHDLTIIKESFSSNSNDYNEPKLIQPQEFEIDDYFLLVYDEPGGQRTEYVSLLEYALLGSDIENLDKGKAVYEKMNSYYSLNREPFSVPEQYRIKGMTDQMLETHYANRHVIDISTDGRRVLTLTYNFINEETTKGWVQIYEIYEGEELIYASSNEGYYQSRYYFSPTPNLDGALINDTENPSGRTYVNFITGNACWVEGIQYEKQFMNYQGDILLTYDDSSLRIVSLNSGHLLNTVKRPENSTILQCLDEFTILTKQYALSEDEVDSVFLVNIATHEKELLISGNIISALLSPDGRYLAYTVSKEENDDAGQSQGFYIKDLEFNTIIFYPTDVLPGFFRIVSWVEKNNLECLFIEEKALTNPSE